MTALVKYNAMCRAIEVAYKVDEVKQIRDTAIALETYARQARNIEAERQACEIRLRAERKAGQLSAKLDRLQGRTAKRKPGMIPRNKKTKTEKLRDAGISSDQARQWEQLAKIADKEFEKALANCEGKPTTNGLIRANKPPDAKPRVSSEAVFVWGKLRDFNRVIVPRDPVDVLFTMTPEMLDEVRKTAPRLASWLNRIK